MNATMKPTPGMPIIYHVTSSGTLNIFKGEDGRYILEHSNLYEVFSRDVFKTYKAARREFACLAN